MSEIDQAIKGFNPEGTGSFTSSPQKNPFSIRSFPLSKSLQRPQTLNPKAESFSDSLVTFSFESASDVTADYLKGVSESVFKISYELSRLKERVEHMEARIGCINVPITTLAPEPYKVIRPINAVVQPREDAFLASFFDANINASGETQNEAVCHLKDIIVATFEMLIEHEESNLGPGPLQQLHVLSEVIQEIPE